MYIFHVDVQKNIKNITMKRLYSKEIKIMCTRGLFSLLTTSFIITFILKSYLYTNVIHLTSAMSGRLFLFNITMIWQIRENSPYLQEFQEVIPKRNQRNLCFLMHDICIKDTLK